MNDLVCTSTLTLTHPVDREVITNERIKHFFVETFRDALAEKVSFEVDADSYTEIKYKSSMVIMTEAEFKDQIEKAESRGIKAYVELMLRVYGS